MDEHNGADSGRIGGAISGFIDPQSKFAGNLVAAYSQSSARLSDATELSGALDNIDLPRERYFAKSTAFSAAFRKATRQALIAYRSSCRA